MKNLKKWLSLELEDKNISFDSLNDQEKINNLVSIFFNRSDLTEYFDNDCLIRTIRVAMEIVDVGLLDLIVLSQNALDRIGLTTNIHDVLDGYYEIEHETQHRKNLRDKMDNMEKLKEMKNGI